MRLLKPFCRLPVRFDAARLRAELAAAPASAWIDHPDDYPGNRALRLITAGGTENDDVAGEMKPTSHLAHFPYLQQVLASFGVVWSRSRFMKLAARGSVPLHCDIKYHWYHRARVHIPIVTNPGVRFTCANETVHMAAGEAWIFDNWMPHSVVNDSDEDRIHLVADTQGNERFWALAGRGQWERFGEPPPAPVAPPLEFKPGEQPKLFFERFNAAIVMHPAELDSLIDRIIGDLPRQGVEGETRALLNRIVMLLKGFCAEWRQLWSLVADHPDGWNYYVQLRKELRTQLPRLPAPTRLRSNGALFMDALQHGVLRYALNLPESAATPGAADPDGATGGRARHLRMSKPVFIVAAPRSGSTLLFETLAESGSFCTLGGEAHHLVEQFAGLQPGGGGVDSNRLTAEHLTPDIAQAVHETLGRELRRSGGAAPAPGEQVRMLEKTPKNALRIPFFKALFPDARFVFLWRDPEENLGSIIDAWQSGEYVMYPALDGIAKPWSLLLPPGWREMRERPLEEIAAFQWRTTNETILDDLARLPAGDWTVVRYADFVADPAREVQRLCEFSGVPFDDALRARVAAPLPLSKHSLSAPDAGKWRRHEAAIARVRPSLEPLLSRLQGLLRS
jgi:hypothetical protein